MRGDRRQAEGAVPVNAAPIGAERHQGHVGVVVGQGTEILQFQVHVVVEELDRFARAHVLKMQVAAADLDAVDTQREGIAGGRVRFGFAGWQLEQLGQVERAVLGEQHLVAGLVELDRLQVQRAFPQAIERQVRVQPFEADLLFAGLAKLQAPQGQLEAEGVEFDALQMRWYGGVLRQLLVGDPQGDTREDEEAEQAVESHESQQGAEGASQSFVHVSLRLSKQECLEYGTLNRFR